MSYFYEVASLAKLDALFKRITSDCLKILLFHGVVDEEEDMDCWWMIKKSKFENQMRYLKDNYNVIALDEAVNILSDPNCRFRDHVVITFDDGYHNYLSNACPIMERFGIPSTVYIPTGAAESRSLIWIDRVFYSIYNYQSDFIDLGQFGLGSGVLREHCDRGRYATEVTNKLKRMPLRKREEICRVLSELVPYIERNGNPFALLSIREIKLLAEKSLVTIGSHTVHHEILTHLSMEHAEKEIVGSKRTLEEWTGGPVDHFAYPNGDYNEDVKKLITKCGYRSAVTADFQLVNTYQPFELPRLGIGARDGMSFFKCLTSGLAAFKEKHRRTLSR